MSLLIYFQNRWVVYRHQQKLMPVSAKICSHDSRVPHNVDITMTVFLSGDVCDCHCSICVYVDSDDSWMYAEGSRYRYHILSQSYPRPTRLYAGKDCNIIIHKNGNVFFLIVRLSNNVYLIYILLDGSNVFVRSIKLSL